MAGGTYTTQNKVRPGAYVNVKSSSPISGTESTTGVVALPVPLDFGPEDQVVEVQAGTDLSVFGYSLSDPKMLLVREALKRANTVLVYRVGAGVKASITQAPITITAKYAGERGNTINVNAVPNPDGQETFEVTTHLAGTVVDTQTARNVEDLEDNTVVEFSGSGALTEFSGALEGGSSTDAVAEDYSKFLSAIQLYEFNTLAVPVEDEAVKTSAISFAKRMREDEGKKIQAVVAGSGADSEAVINVKNGVVLEDGTIISAEQATAWVAAASASAGVASSLTYTAYDGAIDVTQRLISSDIKTALQNGEFLFTEKRGEAVVEQDINSLTTFTSDKGSDFSKNRVLRVLDDIANNTKQTFEDNFIGKIDNDGEGRELFKANRVEYLNALQDAGAITNFAAEEIEVVAGADKDAVVMNAGIQPVDSMEKLYVTVQVA